MTLAPIPAYFVYDGFEEHLDAGAVYERLLKHNDIRNDMFYHMKVFLCASLTANLTADEKEDMIMVPDEARLEEFVT